MRRGAGAVAEGKDWLTTLLLCTLFGVFGAHRFYTGHTVLAVIQLLTTGGFLVWWLIDLLVIALGRFRDANGLVLANRKPAVGAGCLSAVAVSVLVAVMVGVALVRFIARPVADLHRALKAIGGGAMNVHVSADGPSELVDLAQALHPDLHIIEGVVGRDGTGFQRGKNIPMGVALAGINPLAVDSVGATLMGLDPQEVGPLRAARERGLPGTDPNEIRVPIVRDGRLAECRDWQRYRADPPFLVIQRDDVIYGME